MSSQFFQSVIEQMSNVVDCTIGVVDSTMIVVASNDKSMVGSSIGLPFVRMHSENENCFVYNKYTMKYLQGTEKDEFAAFSEGTNVDAERTCNTVAFLLSCVKHYYDQTYDKSYFIKNVLLENIMPGDIYTKCCELHLDPDAARAVFVINCQTELNNSFFSVLSRIIPDTEHNFTVAVTETEVALIKEVQKDTSESDLENLALALLKTIERDAYVTSKIGIGGVAKSIGGLQKSFKEAKISLEIGKVFKEESKILSYCNLGITRLIYQLPNSVCESFIREVFTKGSIYSLDDEVLDTIKVFFENNLNASETARKMQIHRNTLVYRLKKVKKLTGFDLLNFDEAVNFKMSVMIHKYLQSGAAKR